MSYDVGAITAEIQKRFQLFTPPGMPAKEVADMMESEKNKATPGNIRVLLALLRTLTTSLQRQRMDTPEWLPDAGVVVWDHDMEEWIKRLENYEAIAEAAPLGDRQAILWDVTAPLLLGLYGGKESKLPRSTIDAGTPFRLANGLSITDAWREERWDMFKQELKDGVKDVGLDIGMVILIAGATALGFTFLMSLARGRR